MPFFLCETSPCLQTTQGLLLNTLGRILQFGKPTCTESVIEIGPSAVCKRALQVVHYNRLNAAQPIHGSQLYNSS